MPTIPVGSIYPANQHPTQCSDMDALTAAICDLVTAYRERTKLMIPQAQAPPDVHCANCGSPKWRPGGMGQQFRKCQDCGTIGDTIDEPSDD